MTAPIQIDFKKHYAIELELRDDINAAIEKFVGQVSLVSVVGILEVVKQEIIERHKDL